MTFDVELAALLDAACVTTVEATNEGFRYSCRCGFCSCPTLTEAQARTYATMHEQAPRRTG